MRDPNRLYKFYDEVRRIHVEHFPDWRFGQLMNNFMSWLWMDKKIDCFFPEESDMIDYFREFANDKKTEGGTRDVV